MNLIRQGYYKEMPHGEETDPSILDFVGGGKTEEIDSICAYLRSGAVLVTCCGIATDVINAENGIAGVPSVITDGKWVWPGDLSYYVEKYRLALDPEFVSDMRSRDWHVTLREKLDYEGIEIDGKKLLGE